MVVWDILDEFLGEFYEEAGCIREYNQEVIGAVAYAVYFAICEWREELGMEEENV